MSEVSVKTPKIWLIAAICGVLAFLALLVLAGYSTGASVIVGVLVAALVSILLWIGWYEDDAAVAEGHPEADVTTDGLMHTAGVGDEPATPVADEIAPEPHAADTREVRSSAAAATPEATPVSDEGGTKPEFLAGPMGGAADNLKEIKGVGPKLEQLLHSMGIFHFSQIAGWGDAEVAWMDENLKGFKGRVTRDDWVAQATTLAAGGETEFSKRVEDGDVY
ncbi:NADH:ubiquinone oxidoreductase [Celeribacter litoreus]|uniref:NADH:ubiquinone oxidoreductase n=1 Tax=Celeribacter litoreus TaxID=2876714 RepID=UPI001CC91BB3|nr:NADH:ubiquinone oxidoreductase [Celeribacter litoreus]MCA0045262.1 NADH:ubiquinone oxidoreductase [Celeribacter litoreus]